MSVSDFDPGFFTADSIRDRLKTDEAKKAKNFAEADKIRDDLKAQGIEVADVRGGAVWKRI